MRACVRLEKERERESEVYCAFTPFIMSHAAAAPPARRRPSAEEEPIEPTDWDLIVLGSGLGECLVAR